MNKKSPARSAMNFDDVRAIGLRPSVKVSTAAAAMDVDISTIYKLIKRGSIESYRMGSEFRIFVDSITAFQRDGDPAPNKTTRPSRKASARQSLPPSHYEAMAYLEKVLAR